MGCRLECRWNPECLDGLLPRRSSFGDVDAWVEISGQFLFLEQKGGNAGGLSVGQGNALRRLASLPDCTVWFIQNRQDGGYWFRDMRPPVTNPAIPISQDDLCDMVATWGEWADSKGHTMTPVRPAQMRVKVTS